VENSRCNRHTGHLLPLTVLMALLHRQSRMSPH